MEEVNNGLAKMVIFVLYCLSIVLCLPASTRAVDSSSDANALTHGSQTTKTSKEADQVINLTETSDPEGKKEAGGKTSLISPTASLILALAALAAACINLWYYRRQLRQQKIQQKIQHTQNLLDKFYGPFRTLKKTNTNLEQLLKLQQTEKGPTRGEWRTLDRLLNDYKFSHNEKVLIETIIQINSELDHLIETNCGLITNEELQEKVHVFRAHHRVIKAAYEGQLRGEFWRFKDYVYPRELDNLIDQEAERLQRDLTSLQKKK